MIELYDVGRVLIKPFEAGYKFIAEQGQDYISDAAALERIKAFHKDRSLKLAQGDFDLLDKAWLAATRQGILDVDPAQLVYSDVQPRFQGVKATGNQVILHTSGSRDLIKAMLGNVYNSVDDVITGSDGDKNHPETFTGIAEQYQGNIRLFCDDKPSVLDAAYDGFKTVGIHPALYLVDRKSIVAVQIVQRLADRGIPKITSLDQIAD